MTHTTEAFTASCIDFRFQAYIEDWLHQHVGKGNYDRVAWAGGMKDLDGIMGQLDISVRLHHIRTAILINHEDCGAYGESGTPEKHREDLLRAKAAIGDRYPEVNVSLYYLHLDGTFEQIQST